MSSFSFVALATMACSSPASDAPPCVGAKCDAPEHIDVASCTLVDVFGFEGQMNGAYDYDLGGFNRANPELARVSLSRSADAMTMTLGAIEVTDVAELTPLTGDDELFVDATLRRWQGVDDVSGAEFQLLMFEENGVALVKHRDVGDEHFSQFAAADCLPSNQPAMAAAGCEGTAADESGVCRRANGQFAPASCCESLAGNVTATADSLQCTVVAYDSFLDEAMGTPYDYEDGGERLSEEGAEDVELEIDPQFSDLPSGHLFSLGQLNVGMHSAGDTIEFSSTPPADIEIADTSFARYRLQFADSSEAFEVRVFTDLGTGIIFEENQSEPFAQLDCRDSYRAPEFLF